MCICAAVYTNECIYGDLPDGFLWGVALALECCSKPAGMGYCWWESMVILCFMMKGAVVGIPGLRGVFFCRIRFDFLVFC